MHSCDALRLTSRQLTERHVEAQAFAAEARLSGALWENHECSGTEACQTCGAGGARQEAEPHPIPLRLLPGARQEAYGFEAELKIIHSPEHLLQARSAGFERTMRCKGPKEAEVRSRPPLGVLVILRTDGLHLLSQCLWQEDD